MVVRQRTPPVPIRRQLRKKIRFMGFTQSRLPNRRQERTAPRPFHDPVRRTQVRPVDVPPVAAHANADHD